MHELWQQLLPNPEPGTAELLWRFIDLLIDANTRLNLTRIDSRDDAAVKHVADALTLMPFLPTGPFDLCDIGTGGGVPGVVLAIVRPDVNVTLVDSTGKKIEAVRDIVDSMRLLNVKLLHMRAEAVTRRYEIVTARGVAAMPKLLPWAVPLLKSNGTVLAMKGPKVHEEIDASSDAIKRWKLIIETYDVQTPGLEGHVIARIARGRMPFEINSG